MGRRKSLSAGPTDFRASQTSPIKPGDRWIQKLKSPILSLKNSSFLLGKEIKFSRTIVHCRPLLPDKLTDEPLLLFSPKPAQYHLLPPSTDPVPFLKSSAFPNSPPTCMFF
jgi:hypothetical protein